MTEKDIVNINVSYEDLITSNTLKAQIPTTPKGIETVYTAREEIKSVLRGDDPRKLVIVGPCSIHDPAAAIEYATRLKEFLDSSKEVRDQYVVIMRAYFEKPRTVLGWEGLITDPHLDGSDDMKLGLHLSRQLLHDIAEMGLPTATEYLENVTPQYNDDLVSWAAIGARTAYSPQHRKLASGLSMPVGIKNETHGDVQIAVNAVLYAREPHTFTGPNGDGQQSIVRTNGNPYGHIVLRGGTTEYSIADITEGRNWLKIQGLPPGLIMGGTNYDSVSVHQAQAMLETVNLPQRLIIDTSHDNSIDDSGQKNYEMQSVVFWDGIKQIKDGNEGIVGFMIESNLVAGNQKLTDEPTKLQHGQSITDACQSLEDTVNLLGDSARTLSTRVFPV